MAFDLMKQLCSELQLSKTAVEAVIKLLQEGSTIPFIARYRKEATGNLDEVQIRLIEEKYQYYEELQSRKKTILESIDGQGKLTEELKDKIENSLSKTEIEDLYLPFKPKKRSKALIAKEKGLEPFALYILSQELNRDPKEEALKYIDAAKEVHTIEDVYAGALDIVAESVAENADIRGLVRKCFLAEGMIVSKVVEGKDKEPTKFESYYDYKEPLSKIPSHRYLAIRRGENEGILDFSIEIPKDFLMEDMQNLLNLNERSLFKELLEKGIQLAYKRHLFSSVETETRVDLKIKSDESAVQIFAENLRHLLLSAPMGTKTVLGIDPGMRTGCKCVIVDETGQFIENDTIYLFQSDSQKNQAIEIIVRWIEKYRPFAIAIGNGTAGRETEKFIRDLMDLIKKDILIIPVNEAGASVYSASDIAREEFPDLDLTVRGAISIARRLQDPLAELVKIDPKAIGVGQYQHDVHQPLLQSKLHDVVESCVNKVGVELNTASASLLSYVSGIGPNMALKIVGHRNKNGLFKKREDIKEVTGFGPKTFEQAAGFLRIASSENPLDASAVHPERYAIVEQMAKDLQVSVKELVNNDELVKKIQVKKYLSDTVGEHTLNDILQELLKPGRDPRESFETIKFNKDVNSLTDLKVGMVLEGVVTNVVAFGAFVDIGVHQDGLIHVSELTDRYIKDPAEVVQPGKRLKVAVKEIDVARKRISLTAKLEKKVEDKKPVNQTIKPTKAKFSNNPFANL